MSRNRETTQADIVRELVQLLIRGTKDTLEGLVQWRLPEQRIARETMLVRQALDELIARGWVQTSTGRDGRTYYSVNPKRLAEIRSCLRDPASVPTD